MRKQFGLGLFLMAFSVITGSVSAQGGGGGGAGGLGGGGGGIGGGGGGLSGGGISSGGLGGGSGFSGGSGSSSGGLGGGSGFSGGSGNSMGRTAIGNSSGSSRNTFGQQNVNGSSQGISSANPFQQYYQNPFNVKLDTLSGYANVSSAVFGNPSYPSSIFGVGTSSNPGRSGATGMNGRSGSGSGQTTTFTPHTSTSFTPRTLPYVTDLGDSITNASTFQSPIPGAAERNAMRGKLENILSSASNRLPSGKNIEVAFEGNQVVLKGEVSSERERRLAANMVLLTPGIRGIRNELQVKAPISTFSPSNNPPE